MIRHLASRLVWLALVAVVLVPALPAEAQEPGGRMLVFIPDIRPADDSNRRFGERTANELRTLINNLTTHAPVDARAVRDALRRYSLDMRALTCAEARQLSVILQAEIVVCADFARQGSQHVFNTSFISVSTGESFEIEGLLVDGNERAAAAAIFAEFGGMIEQSSVAFYCQQDFQGQNWEGALARCNRAVELAPDVVSTRLVRGHTLRETGELEGALADYRHVLGIEPTHESALQNAGYVAAQLGHHEEARRHYMAYLRLNPTNTTIRMREAYALAQSGDPLGALAMVEEGVAHDPDNAELYRQIANFAFAAASDARRLSPATEREVSPEVRELFTRAIQAYSVVFSAEGVESSPREYRNTVVANIQLGNLAGAIAVSEVALEAHPDEAVLWSVYADALQRTGGLERALDALEQVKRIDPEYENVAARQGRWLLDSGRHDEALAAFRLAVDRREQSPDNIATLLFGEGYQRGNQRNDHAYAIRFYEAAKNFQVSPRMRSQLDFWHGVSLYHRAEAAQAPGTAAAARQTLPMFEQALALLQGGREYVATTNINLQQYLDGATRYVEIQELIIRRDGRR